MLREELTNTLLRLNNPDPALAALAGRYADALDEDQSSKALADLGPKLLAVLIELGAEKASSVSVGRVSRLDELRSKRIG